MNSVFKKEILKGKTAVVTGGASGIGMGISESFAQAGANLVIASRRKALCEEFASKISSQYGVKAIGKELDVRDSTQVNTVFQEASDEMGELNIFINNAAGNFYFPSSRMRDKLWHSVIDIDLNGTFYCSRAAFKHLQKAGGGSILNTSMTLHYSGWLGMPHATAAKAGIDALTKTLAVEWGEYRIRVNAVAPGPIITEGVKKAFETSEHSFDEMLDYIPLKRSGEPHEIGGLMVFMASDAASWMTGSIVVLDGGESLAKHRGMPTLSQIEETIKNRKKNK